MTGFNILLDYNGVSYDRHVGDTVAQKTTTTGSYVYVAIAPPGTPYSSAKWRIKRTETSGSNSYVTWADGNCNFDNIATDLTILNYL